MAKCPGNPASSTPARRLAARNRPMRATSADIDDVTFQNRGDQTVPMSKKHPIPAPPIPRSQRWGIFLSLPTPASKVESAYCLS